MSIQAGDKPRTLRDVLMKVYGGDHGVVDRMIQTWGADRTREIVQAEFERGTVEVETVKRKHPRHPAVSTPAERVYWKLIGTLGRPEGTTRVHMGPPSPARAWLEVMDGQNVSSPSFSHEHIADALRSVGGYKSVKSENLNRMRRDFMRMYEQLVKGGNW